MVRVSVSRPAPFGRDDAADVARLMKSGPWVTWHPAHTQLNGRPSLSVGVRRVVVEGDPPEWRWRVADVPGAPPIEAPSYW